MDALTTWEMLVTAGVHLFAAVLVVSGADKLLDPAPAQRAMRSAGLPARMTVLHPGRLLGAVEAGVGISALVIGGPVFAAAIATVYLAFASFVLLLRDRDAAAGCGCFGAADAAPGPAHLALNLVAAASAAAAVAVDTGTVLDIIDEGVTTAVPYAALLVTGSALLLLGPALFAELRSSRTDRPPRTFSLDG